MGKFENNPYPGVEQLLQKLTDSGCKLYVATSKPEGMSVEILEKFGLAKYFTLICGATLDGSRSKKADIITYLLEKAGGAENAVMVGDTAYDMIGAAAHGMPSVAVAWGYGKVDDMLAAGASAVAFSMDELFHCLMQL